MGDMEPLYTLKEAVEKYFPGGTITVAALRTEIRKGRLIPERIAGKFCVTESAIRRMRKLCREKPRPQGSTCATEPERRNNPQDVVREMLKRPTKKLRGSSRTRLGLT